MGLIPAFIRRRIAHRPNLVKIVDNIGWLFFDKVLRMGVGLLVGVWVARYLGPAQFGLLSFALAFTSLFSPVANLGLQGTVVREIVRDNQSARLTLGSAAILQLIGGCASFLLIVLGIYQLRPDDPLARSIVIILGAIMLFKASEVALYWFESQIQSKYAVWVQNGVFLMFATLKIVFILMEYPLIVFAWLMLGEAIVVALALTLMMNHLGPTLLNLRASSQQLKILLKDSWPLALSGVAVVVYMKIGQVMLGQMVTEEAVGIYTAAISISEVWYFIPMAIVASVTPSIITARKQNMELYLSRLQNLYSTLVWMCMAVAIPMTFLATPLVELLFGSTYSSGGTVLAIHIWSSVFVCLGVASSQYLLAENRQMIALQRTLAGMMLNIGLNFLLIPLYGPIGAAISTVCSQAFAALFFDFFQKFTRPMFLMKVKAFNLKELLRIRHMKFN